MQYQFARASITKYYTLGGLNSNEGLSHSPGSQKFKMKVSVGWVTSEAFLLDLAMASFSVSSCGPSVCVHAWWFSVCSYSLSF